ALVQSNSNNFYPRVGFAWKPFNDEKTVLRGGYGVYGNTIYGSAAASRVGGPFSGSESFTNSIVNGSPLFSFPRPFLDAGTTSTQNVSGINPNLRTPHSQQFNLTLEREVAHVGLRVSYIGTRSTQLVYARNLNQPPASLVPFTAARRIYPAYNTITWYDNGGNQQYNSLQVSAARSYGKNLSFNTGWTWAKDITDTQNTGSGFSGPTIENQFNRSAERADNVLTRTHRVYGNLIYDLPFGRGQRFGANIPGFVDAVAGGWNMSWIFVRQSGQFFTPTFTGFDISNTNTLSGRPDRIGSGKLDSGQSLQRWFDASAFKVPGCPDTDPICAKPANIGRFGNSGLNVLRGPSSTNFDLSASKYFRLGDRVTLQLRMLATNIFNHPNFMLTNTSISSPGTVGRITSTFQEQIGEDARQIHFNLRLQF
ncbi:MAG: hypothetical protein M3Z36_01410, partial [Acidobacteriota bacterium]|nr:hypothetical protein [Acidobacteriota bacterium]